jgi:hypothetical protein
MATTLVNTSTQFNNHNLYEAEASNPNSSNSDTYNKISNYHNNNGKTTKNDSTNNDDGESGKYSEMIHRNQRSREKISTYM